MAFLYRELADQFSADINAGTLAAGAKMPSIRHVSQQRQLSINTVQKSYELLEAQGYIVVKAQSGFYVRVVSHGLNDSIFSAFSPQVESIDKITLLNDIISASSSSNRLALGTITLATCLMPAKMLQRSLIRAMRSQPCSGLVYSAVRGEPVLQQAIIEHFAHDAIHINKEQLIITNGAMQALSLAILSISKPGDNIAVPTPCYSGQLLLLANLERNIIEIPTNSQGIDMAVLEQVMATGKVAGTLLSACYQNPLGYSLSINDKRKIAHWAEIYQCPVIEDDVFGECGYNTQRPAPIKSWDKQGYVIWCASFSKTLAPGYRIGWCASGRFTPQLQRQLLSRSLAVNAPLQLALADFVNCGQYRRHLNNLRVQLAAQVDALYQSVSRHFPKGCRCSKPAGGYALWVQLPEVVDAFDIYQQALEKGINIVPGVVFSADQKYQNCLRLNAGNPWHEDLDQGVKTLADLVFVALGDLK